MVMKGKLVPPELGMMPVGLTRAHKACMQPSGRKNNGSKTVMPKYFRHSRNDRRLGVVSRGSSEHFLTDLKG